MTEKFDSTRLSQAEVEDLKHSKEMAARVAMSSFYADAELRKTNAQSKLKIASLTLALQAAHKGLNRLSKQNKQLKVDLAFLEKLSGDFDREHARRIQCDETIKSLHKRLAEISTGKPYPPPINFDSVDEYSADDDGLMSLIERVQEEQRASGWTPKEGPIKVEDTATGSGKVGFFFPWMSKDRGTGV